MSFETGLRLSMAAMLMVGAAVAWRSGRSPLALQWRGVQFVERNLAIVEEQFVPVVNGHFRRQQQATAAALLVAGPAILVVPFDIEQSLIGIYSISALSAGLMCVGFALVSAREATHPFVPDTVTRTARLRSVTVGDLVPHWVRLLAWAIVGGVVVAVSFTWSLSPSSARPAAAAGMVALCVGLVATEIAARMVCVAPEPATDAAHLYWQDALRADSIGTAYNQLHFGASLAWSGWATMLIAEAASDLSMAVAMTVGFGAMVISVAAQLAWSMGTPWFRRRLWPHLGKGEVVVPGRQVAA